MKIKLVKFNDIQNNGATLSDYSLRINGEYDVIERNMETRSFRIVNDVGTELLFYEDGVVEIIND